MEIKYDVYWKTEKGHTRITHGTISDSELQDMIERKEREECSGVEDWEFDSATVDSFSV